MQPSPKVVIDDTLKVVISDTIPNLDAAFATFDSLLTASSYAQQQLGVVAGVDTREDTGAVDADEPLQVAYPATTWASYNQRMNIMYVTQAFGMSYDTIAHEYGHYIEDVAGFATNASVGSHKASSNLRMSSRMLHRS